MDRTDMTSHHNDRPMMVTGDHLAGSTTEIVVAYKHLDRVIQTLREHDIGPRLAAPVDKDEDLGLGLIHLEDAAAAAEKLSNPDYHRHAAPPAGAEPYRLQGTRWPSDPSAGELDRFLCGLRGYFRETASGWAPVVGKNRLVGPVQVEGKVSHGGGGTLKATDRKFQPRGKLPGYRARRNGQLDDSKEHEVGLAGAGVRVAVLDTRISPVPWLAGGWIGSPSDLLDGGTPRDVALHATFIGGLILDQAPGATLQFRGVLDADQGVATSWDVAKAIVALSRTRPHVLNLSMVCYTEDGEPPLAISTAIDAVDRDTVIVAAAGNHGDLQEPPGRDENREFAALSPEDQVATLARERRKPSWPAALDRVVAVGCADSSGDRSAFTPDDVGWIDVLAVGNEVVSTFHDGEVLVAKGDRPGGRPKVVGTQFHGYAEWGGTSFAAAKVTGAIAALTKPGKRSSQEAWKEVFGPEPGARPRFVDIPPVHLG